MNPNLPSGTVTFLFTDIEGSTKLAQEHPETWETLRALHHSILKDAIESNKGFIFQVIGDAFCAAFHTTEDAIGAAVKSQLNLHAENWGNAPIRVRMGIHSGKADVQDHGQYIGYQTLSRVQRLMSAGSGEQTLVSSTTEQLARDNLPKGVALRDLGKRRLKDMRQPEHIFQVIVPDLPADFPPLRGLEASPTNLPAPMTRFIGREKEMAEIKHALREHRLVTLTGSGGSGKTRLCLQVGADMLDQYSDGVWLVELAPLFDPALVLHGVASQFGLKEEAGGSLETNLRDYLREKHLVLILDNCEHLLAACAQFADTFLRACPKLKILASSREALGIAGECAYRVPSLSVPDPKQLPSVETLSQFDAVRMFIDRARMVQPSFGLTHQNAPAVAQICYRLDGIPLAIELAASRVQALRVEELEQRLDDRFRLLTVGNRSALPRQQTLRALIDWSYDLLSEPERALLRRLSVFAGGWTLEAAESVCADEKPIPAPPSQTGKSMGGIDRDDLLDLIHHLVGKSLIMLDEQVGGTRYRMLETIRQYAREKFFASGESENIRNRHLDFYLKFAEQAEPKLHSAEQLLWFNRLETEHDNLRAAQDRALASGQVDTGIRLTWAMLWLWFMRGHWTEGRERTARLLALLDPGDKTLGRALVLGAAGSLAAMQRDTTLAHRLVDECLDIVTRVSDQNKRTVAGLLIWLAFGKYLSGDSPAAHSMTEWSLALARETAYGWGVAYSRGMLGLLAADQQDYAAARELLEESVAAFRALGDEWAQAAFSHNLASIQLILGEYASARSTCESIITIQRELGNRFNLGHAIGNLAQVERAERNYAAARVLMDECVEIFRALGARPAYQMWLADLARIEGDYERAAALHRESLSLYAEAKRSDVIALSLELFAWLAVSQADNIRAARLFGAADALFAATGERMDPMERAEHEQNESTTRTQLGAAEFAAAWAEGRALSMDQAIAYALV